MGVVVYLRDQNNNGPMFSQESYEVWVGTEISQVTAQDPDSEVFGSESIKYEQKDDTITHQNLFPPKWRLSMRQSARPATPGQAGSSQLSPSPLLEKICSNIREFY